jgi:dTDP-4-dehydrorhamnose reductase
VRVLVIGADSPTGLALVRHFTLRGREFSELSLADSRWKSERQVKKALRRSDSDLVIDTRIQSTADGGIQLHETDIERSRWLAKSSQALKLTLIHLSCARVFTGQVISPYAEDAQTDGISSIARLLISAEQDIMEFCERHVILRLGPVFSPEGINVITHMLAQLHDGGSLVLDRHQHGCPVPAEDAARVVAGMVDQFSCGLEAWGIYHYCSADTTNCYEFAEVLLAAASQYEEFAPDAVQLVGGDEIESLHRNLRCDKLKNTFAITQQPWRASVAGQVKQFYAEAKLEEVRDVQSHGHRDAST